MQDRRVFTEGPDNLIEDENINEESYLDEISPEQLQELLKNPKFAALFFNSKIIL